MLDHTYTVPSKIGPVALTYSDKGLLRVRLVTGKSRDESAETAPAWVTAAARDIVRSIAGESVDLSGIPLDFADQPPFFTKVYHQARKVKFGQQTTYLDLARKAGSPKASRAVGQAMARNPWLIVVPCHRVLGAGGAMGGFSAPGGITTKRKLLDAEAHGCS